MTLVDLGVLPIIMCGACACREQSGRIPHSVNSYGLG